MNFEEKMLEMLSEIKGDITELKTDMATVRDDIAELQDSVRRIGIIQENIEVPRLDSLAARQKNLRKISAPAKSVEQIIEDISVLKSIVKAHSDRLAALEKAQ